MNCKVFLSNYIIQICFHDSTTLKENGTFSGAKAMIHTYNLAISTTRSLDLMYILPLPLHGNLRSIVH